MVSPEDFMTRTLKSHPQGSAVARILAASINAVDPAEAVRKAFSLENGRIVLRSDSHQPAENEFENIRRIKVFALGKAAPAMTRALVEILGDKISAGLMVVKHPDPALPPGFEQIVGGHPIPNQGSLLAGEKVKAFVSGLSPHDLLICLISGGGSALLSAPRPGLSLEDLQELTGVLLASGASIDEINTLRRHLDVVKGGGLARMAFPARVLSLILSDVIGNPLEAIASGPTSQDPTTRFDALEIIDKYRLKTKISRSILSCLNDESHETLKPGDPLLNSVRNELVGTNLLAASAGLIQAQKEGMNIHYLGGELRGEAREASAELVRLLRQVLDTGAPVTRPFCMIAGGETTVTLRGNGLGGRNQEVALTAVESLAGMENCMLVTLATDGEDGPTDAAGAVVSNESAQIAHKLGCSAGAYLKNNDSYHFFSQLDDLLLFGPTGTNVNDLNFLFAF